MFVPKIIAKIQSDYQSKFGVPRQSGLVGGVSRVAFEKPYRISEALRGIEEFSHIWILWYFHKNGESTEFSPTVRPPKLGGNKRVGVFATRSPNRPNPIGLSLVKLLGVDEDGSLIIEGGDMVDGTPVLDIKPYLPYVESVPDAHGSFTEEKSKVRLYVDFPPVLLEKVDEKHSESIIELLSLDPRPGYQHDSDRVYGVSYAGYNIKFKVAAETLTVVAVETDATKTDK